MTPLGGVGGRGDCHTFVAGDGVSMVGYEVGCSNPEALKSCLVQRVMGAETKQRGI